MLSLTDQATGEGRVMTNEAGHDHQHAWSFGKLPEKK